MATVWGDSGQKGHVVLCFVAALLYGVNKLLLLDIDFLRCYFNDILCGMVFFPAVVVVSALCGIERIPSKLQHGMAVLALTILAGLFWEFVTPLYWPSSVCDPLDIVCYMGGCVMYLLLRNKLQALFA